MQHFLWRLAHWVGLKLLAFVVWVRLKLRFMLFTTARRSSLPIPAKKWQTPPPGHFKLNVDGALSLNSGLRGVGVVVRNSYGRLCGAVAMRAPSLLSILATDLYAPKIGISFAMDASITPLIIESDCHPYDPPGKSLLCGRRGSRRRD
ncbi:unnamed protein product [Prunus armeniaca]|uniref:RNase H type-1 domain-containing protein n=1 Tax=Prunus armeniaca TaxID=36596 RepID=A0A6J5W1V5_PRUAR|nr:unnamed protein product [Prunus armeniaca]